MAATYLDQGGPLYMTPPSTEPIRAEIRVGRLGMIATPAQGNRVEEDYGFWCADNGVFGGNYPGDEAYLAWLRTLQPHADRCAFVTAPDVVGDHFATYNRCRDMMPRIRDLGFPVAFVAQDHFEYEGWYLWDEFDALFIGGSTEWKLGEQAALIARTAGAMGKWVHMGRVNSAKRLDYASWVCECDSVDGTYMTFAPDENLPNVLAWGTNLGCQTSIGDDVDLLIGDRWVPQARGRRPARVQRTLDGQLGLFESGQEDGAFPAQEKPHSSTQ